MLPINPVITMHAEPMSHDFIHPQLNEEVRSIAGYYLISREERFSHRGRELFYLVGYGVADSTCCGMAGMSYALVAGYLLAWKIKISAEGLAISEVERIVADEEKREIATLIRSREQVTQVNFG